LQMSRNDLLHFTNSSLSNLSVDIHIYIFEGNILEENRFSVTAKALHWIARYRP
jgi:hypothetical protein